MSYGDYLALERAAGRKHEYVNGRVYAMAGGTPEHARLAGALITALATRLDGKRCAPFTSDLRVRIVATGRSTYPDVTVVCGQLEHAPDDDEAVTNPTVIVEVLSETTGRDDRGDKWRHYQRIPALREYVLVSQGTPRVEVFSRDGAQPDLWRYRDHGAGSEIALESLGVRLPLDTLYANPLA